MVMKRTVLILGGTTEARALAEELCRDSGLRIISSLAGRTLAPRLPPGETRLGGFGGIGGLVGYLREHKVDAVVDATHPFAARMGWNAARACPAAGVDLLRLERPAWTPSPDDHWIEIDDWDEAAAHLGHAASRVLLAIGRQELGTFTALAHPWFLVRMVSPPDPPPVFVNGRLILARGPFTTEAERRLLESERIDTIVCKNSGGRTDAKLEAARALGLRVVMRRRPLRPATETVATIDQAIAWIRTVQRLSPTALP